MSPKKPPPRLTNLTSRFGSRNPRDPKPRPDFEFVTDSETGVRHVALTKKTMPDPTPDKSAKAQHLKPKAERRLRDLYARHGLAGVGGMLNEMRRYQAETLPTERQAEIRAELSDPNSDASTIRVLLRDLNAIRRQRDKNPREFLEMFFSDTLRRQTPEDSAGDTTDEDPDER